MGDVVEVDVGAVAHGGHFVSRLAGRVVFVRHALPGERVRARLTEAAEGASYWRADAVEVVRASPDRVPSAWPAAGPRGVGGGELAHVALGAQRVLKGQVVAEALQRLAGLEVAVGVEAAPGDDERGGLRWRTRISLVADDDGRAGMHGHRSSDVVALEAMPLATDTVAALRLFERRWPPGSRIQVAAPAGGDRPVVLVDGVPWGAHGPDRRLNARTSVHEVVVAGGAQCRYRVAAKGFWQVHREAPEMLVDAVLVALEEVEPGGTVLDLYAGAGLFTVPLAGRVGPRGTVVAVEGDRRASRDARRNAHHLGQVELLVGDVGRVLAGLPSDPVDAVVLDPPRTGAGRAVVARVAVRRPRVVVYVACDPAALARDVAYFADHGYALATLRALDLYPMTHHVECVAVLRGQR